MACDELGLQERTLQRWRSKPADGRPSATRPTPANKLSEPDRQAVLAAAHRADCASLTPHQIVPKLADEGVYIASESTFYRVQVWGGYGYVHEYGIEQAVRDSRIAMIYEGTNEIQAIDLLQRKVLIDGGARLERLLTRLTLPLESVPHSRVTN